MALPQTMTVGSSLASVFGPELGESHHDNFVEWRLRQLKSDHPLAQLHAKFWGKSMADEEEEWRKAQPPSPAGSLEHEGQDGEDNMDEGDEEPEEVDGFGVVRVDDIIRGCYMLKIGVEELDISEMWIRAEYIRIFDHIEVFFNKPGFPPGRAPSAVITGQPGIGKSVWIYYALRRYLAEKKPVIWYRDQICYLFVDEGVYRAPPDYPASGFKTFVRTLVDSDQSQSGVPERLVCHGTRHAVIYTTSPRRERWERLHKTVRVITVIMKPWARMEILRVARGLFPELEEERIDDIFDRFGPTPRLCFEYLCDSNLLNDYQAQVTNIVSGITMQKLERLLKDAHNLSMDSDSEKICLLSREGGLPGNAVVEFITPTMQSRLAIQFRILV